ncbi:DUF4494 domain-containing protein [Flavobacterium sp. 5]|uniref:DUF4494 domain-containing protein n=1 Tax=Flavobacterium sp. 5 TaxID=2035199 RepID=UPI000C2B747F|nr:DUF4494 domain-containing protein [Flavobacterium sp. 5]PKB17960.1 uncharacterized protein DUF4494 [Flavobacterium sp. 5]
MSTIWYECKIKYRKTDEATGTQKVTTEPYLVDALSYTEAESRITEEMSAYISEEFKITNIKTANYAEIHPFENTDRWFKSKVSLMAYDEESGKERKSNMYLLIQANDVREAYDNTVHVMKTTLSEYSIPAISESPIMDVFPYFSGEDEELESLEKFNARKNSKPAVIKDADFEDSMEFETALEEEEIEA